MDQPPVFVRAQCRRSVLPVVTFLIGLAPTLASAAEPTSPPPATDGETLSMSPFQVFASRDIGFVAANALVGGRLATSLGDTAVAYSVLTREFIDALQITDVNAATMWATNANVVRDNGSQSFFGNDTPITFRGAGQNYMRRNFFNIGAGVLTDSYNLDRYDYGRGPNAVLFGAGSFSGTSNLVTKQAQIGQRSERLEAAYGSWDLRRASGDINVPIGSKLAVRADGVYQKGQGWMDRQWEERYGAFGAATYRPFKNTEIRVDAERLVRSNSTPVTMISDSLSGWDGKTVFSGPVLTTPLGATGTQRVSGYDLFVYSPGSGISDIVNYTNTARTIGAGGTALAGGVPVVGATANLNGYDMTRALNVPGNLFATATANSKFRMPGRTFDTAPDGRMFNRNFEDYSATIDQRIGDQLFLQAAANYSIMHFDGNLAAIRGFSQATYLDVNQLLPTGQANPNFLVPYTEAPSVRVYQRTETQDLRLAAAYVVDAGRWGKYNVMAMAGDDRFEGSSRAFNYVLQRNADSRLWPTADQVRYRYYWNDQPRPFHDFGSSVNVIDPSTGTTRAIPIGWVLNSASSGNYDTPSENRYGQGAISGKFWHDRINLLGAVRYDDYTQSTRITKRQMDYPTGWDGHAVLWKPGAPPDLMSLSYVPKNASGVPTGAPAQAITRPRDGSGNPLPQYANDRFQDDYNPADVKAHALTHNLGTMVRVTKVISAGFNYSTTFSPNNSLQLISGQTAEPANAKGWDASVRFRLLDGRVNASVVRYESTEGNSLVNTGNTPSYINTIVNANHKGDLSVNGTNTHGLPEVPLGFYDRRTREADGWEFEVTANLSRAWRLSANAALPRAYQNTPNVDTLAYLSTNDTVLRQILTDAGVLINSANVATVDATVPAGETSPDASAAASAWNNLQAVKLNTPVGRQILTGLSKVTANLFTDYTIQEGRLRGLRFGAGVNYRGKQVIGYTGANTIRDPNNAAVAIVDPRASALQAVYNDAYYIGTVTLGYTRKLSKKLTLGVDLRIDNALGYDDPIYYNTIQRPIGGDVTNPGRVATPYNYSYVTPRNFTLTARLAF